jgi:pimeloyl-ACP methyl ester carboxylesterase
VTSTVGVDVRTGDGLRLVADRHGAGDPVVLVHGLGFSRARWSPQVEALTDAAFASVTFDMRGFGDSEPASAPFAMQDLVADLEAVRVAMGLDAFHLVGHSLGGMVSQLYALEHPERVRSLTLASTTAHSGNRGSAYGAALARLCEHGFDRAMQDDDFRAQVEFAVHALADPAVRKDLSGTLSDELPSGERLLGLIKRMTGEANPARAQGWRCTVGFSSRDRLDRITCPTLVMHGTRDMIIPYVAGQLLAKALGAKWRSAPGAGHNVPTEQAELFNATLLEFLGSSEDH